MSPDPVAPASYLERGFVAGYQRIGLFHASSADRDSVEAEGQVGFALMSPSSPSKLSSTVAQSTEAAVSTEKGTESPHPMNCQFPSMGELNCAFGSLGPGLVLWVLRWLAWSVSG